MICADIETQIGCWAKPDGTRTNVVIHYDYGSNAAGQTILRATRYTDAEGVIVVPDPTAGETVVPGVCMIPNAIIITNNTTIAGAARAATAAFNGASASVDIPALVAAISPTAILQSFTVTAFSTTPGLETLTANQIVVNGVVGRVNLNPGESVTFSVIRDQDQRLIASSPTVVATGTAYANISWTFSL
jgi:hypothetical protein